MLKNFVPNWVSATKYGVINRIYYINCLYSLDFSCCSLHCNNNTNMLHTYWDLQLTFVNIGVYSPFNHSWIYKSFLPNESLLKYAKYATTFHAMATLQGRCQQGETLWGKKSQREMTCWAMATLRVGKRGRRQWCMIGGARGMMLVCCKTIDWQ